MNRNDAEREELQREIRSQIRVCEDQIEEWSGQIARLNEKIDQQKQLEREYAAMEWDMTGCRVEN